MAKFIHQNPLFGQVEVCTRRGMRSIVARWRDGVLHLSCNTAFERNREPIDHFLKQNQAKIQLLRERVARVGAAYYEMGETISTMFFRATVVPGKSNRILPLGNGDYELRISPLCSLASVDANRLINKMLLRVAERHFGELKQMAFAVASEVGVVPNGVVMSRGRSRLGYCTRTGVVSLSVYLLFLPEHLIRYVICHELAHLTHMNHGAEFHALCNSYCYGAEAQLNSQLKTFKWLFR